MKLYAAIAATGLGALVYHVWEATAPLLVELPW